MIVLPLLVSDCLFIPSIVSAFFPLANTLKALIFTADSERHFNERLLVSLGFVKVRGNLIFSKYMSMIFRMKKPVVNVVQ